jgi:hypothetical protein
LLVLVSAFAPFEVRPLTAAVELFRGLAIQLAYRWPTRQIIAEPHHRAVLLWSVPHHRRPTNYPRAVLGVTVAVGVGVVLFLASNALLLLPLGVVLRAAGVDPEDVAGIALAIAGLRLSLTMWRALGAYWHHAKLADRLPAPTSTRWRIDYLAAVPARAGHGGRLLDEFLHQADELDVEVVLCCDGRNLPFYRRHGFHLIDGKAKGGQHLMLRQARSARPPARRQVKRRTPTASQPSSRRPSTRHAAPAGAAWSDVAPGWSNIVAPKIN